MDQEVIDGLYITYRFYDNQGRRLAIFGKVVADGEYLAITVIPCSTKDQFSKVKAKEIYQNLQKDDWYYESYSEPIEGGKSKKAFINWCQDKYFKKMPIMLTYNGFGICQKGMVHLVLHENKVIKSIKPGTVYNKMDSRNEL